MERKPEDREIAAFIDEIAQAPWLNVAGRSWVPFLFHVTDIRNIPSILSTGKLLSRQRATAEGLMVTDNASAKIINATHERVRDSVRLYFRPKTPTAFRNEGIRPLGQRYDGAHCPIPVMLVFDAKQILGAAGTRFSDRNLASSTARLGSDLAFLRTIPFHEVFHNQATRPDDWQVTSRRQAEVIVNQELSLDSLRRIYVRTDPELETLLTLLELDERVTQSLIDHYRPHLRCNRQGQSLMHRRWSFVQQVTVGDTAVRLLFNPSTDTPGPFTAKLEWEHLSSGEFRLEEIQNYVARGWKQHPLPSGFRDSRFRLRLTLDDALAYFAEPKLPGGKLIRASP